jgi:7-cyano-7-deazaguanine reductase
MSEIIANTGLRRALLQTVASPAQRLDYVVTVRRQLKLAAGPARLAIRYVPDALVLDQDAIAGYMHVLEAAPWDSLEDLAATVLEDFSNELVARWIEVGVSKTSQTGGDAVFDYAIVMEDRQPNWSNPHLMGRLKALFQE